MADIAALPRQTVLDLLVLRFVEFHPCIMPYELDLVLTGPRRRDRKTAHVKGFPTSARA